jgi:hypothetical protein
MLRQRKKLVIAVVVFLHVWAFALPTRAQNPAPFIDSFSPTAAAPGIGQDLALTISGAGFATGATVNFDGTSLTPRSITNTQIVVTVPAASLAKAE